MHFETSRCLIRKFEENDIDDFMKYRNDLEWMKYQGFKGLSKQQYLKSLLSPFLIEKGAQLAIINKATGGLIGDLYVKQENKTFWIGYTISPTFARQGLAFECVSGLIDWIKEQGFSRILAAAEPENTPSINLLEKLNFILVGTDEDGDKLYELIC